MKVVIVETDSTCFEILYSDKLTEGLKTFGGVMFVHTLPSGICCASLILFGNEGKNGNGDRKMFFFQKRLNEA